MDPDWLSDVDLIGNGMGFASNVVSDGAGPSHVAAAAPSDSGNNGGQYGQWLAAPTCINGGNECQAASYWRQRVEEANLENNRRLIALNNYTADNARLTSRLREAEKNLRMYQQRIVDSLNSVDPIRKELEDVKNQLLTELREKNRYQCEVESVKATSEQLKAFITNHEAKATAMREQITQLQVREAEKGAEAKKFQEKAVAMEAKYRKTKDELKKLRDEVARLRRVADNAGVGKLQRGMRRRAVITHGTPRVLSQDSSIDEEEEDNDDTGLLAEQLETALAKSPIKTAPPPISIAQPPPPSVPTRGKVGKAPVQIEPQPVPRTKALAVLERKEREEAQGTYVGGAKRLFCPTYRAPQPQSSSAEPSRIPADIDSTTSVKTKVPPSAVPFIRQAFVLASEISAEEALKRVRYALKDVFELPPLSPIPDLPKVRPMISEDGLETESSVDTVTVPVTSTDTLSIKEPEPDHESILNTAPTSTDTLSIKEPEADHEAVLDAAPAVDEMVSHNQVSQPEPMRVEEPVEEAVENSFRPNEDGEPMEICTEQAPDETKTPDPSNNEDAATTVSTDHDVVSSDNADRAPTIAAEMAIDIADSVEPMENLHKSSIGVAGLEEESKEDGSLDNGHSSEAIPLIVTPNVKEDDEKIEDASVSFPSIDDSAINLVIDTGDDEALPHDQPPPFVPEVTTPTAKLEVEDTKGTAKTAEAPTEIKEPAARPKARGRQPIKAPAMKAPTLEALSVPINRSGKTELASAGIGRVIPPDPENACRRTLPKAAKIYRPYAAILDSMLIGGGSSHVGALEKWMAKPKQPAETIAYCFIDAIKRHNSSIPWIATQFKTGIQESTRRSTNAAKTAPMSGHQALPSNDKKLAELLDSLVSQDADGTDWEKTPNLILSQLKWQLGSNWRHEMDAMQREALCRWIFYLCERRPSRKNFDLVKEVLLMATYRDDRGQAKQQSDQSILNIFLTLAMVWPKAFKKLIIDAASAMERILQMIFQTLLWNSSSKAKAERLLEIWVGGLGGLDKVKPMEQPSFDILIREQLANLACVSASVEMSDAGIMASMEVATCVDKLLMIAPYCDERSLALFAEPCLISVIDWMSINQEDAAARGGTNKLISDMVILSKVAPFFQAPISRNMGAVLKSLRAIVFEDPSGEFRPAASERPLLICAAIGLLIDLSASASFGHIRKIEKMLEELMEELKKEKAFGEKVKQYYGRRYMEFQKRRVRGTSSSKK